MDRTLQRITDGTLARYYTIPEWKQFVAPYFSVEDAKVFGSKGEILPIPGGKLKDAIMRPIPEAAVRFLTNTCRWGFYLWTPLRSKK